MPTAAERFRRFAPLYIDVQQYGSIHALNENIYQSELPMGVDFYKKVVYKTQKRLK